ncbi:alpha/beta hydrolase [uncultured Hydrogenophaga sp.]|uniref:alpha/beta fold hydrolase n=1 Tax=uncultured Hydrogenophaga sp. TaxID=199683 RepID=UPI002587CD22|nr:alpha/beta hydrolase [uncultured Hydrogenophaga sp.]
MSSLLQTILQRTVIDGGIEIHYAEAGEGTPLIFVHGGMGDWRTWDPQWADFTQRYRCITYSRRFSSPNRNTLSTTDHSVRAEAKDLAALLERWNAGPALIVGTSYGAYTALQMALDAPRKVRALALTEAPVLPLADRVNGGRQAREAFQRDVIRPADEAFRVGDIERAVTLLTVGINGVGPGEASTRAGWERRMRNAEAMRALAFSSDAYPALDEKSLRGCAIPTLLLTGENTMPIHRATTQALIELLPHASLKVVPGCGHGVHRDNPTVFNRTVLDFFKQV